jgi:hypothetical protein
MDIKRRDRSKGRELRRTFAASRVEAAVGPIVQGMDVWGLTDGRWSLIDLIRWCLAATGPAKITLATWTAGGADLNFLRRLKDAGTVLSMRAVVDSSFGSRKPADLETLKFAFGADSIRATQVHAKFCLIRNTDWNLCIRGSQNLTENPRVEMFEVSDNAEMCDWLDAFVDRLFANQDPKQAAQMAESDFRSQCIRSYDSDLAGFGGPGVMPDAAAAPWFYSDEPFGVDLRRVGVSYL